MNQNLLLRQARFQSLFQYVLIDKFLKSGATITKFAKHLSKNESYQMAYEQENLTFLVTFTKEFRPINLPSIFVQYS